METRAGTFSLCGNSWRLNVHHHGHQYKRNSIFNTIGGGLSRNEFMPFVAEKTPCGYRD
jgi:hypothetical protein